VRESCACTFTILVVVRIEELPEAKDNLSVPFASDKKDTPSDNNNKPLEPIEIVMLTMFSESANGKTILEPWLGIIKILDSGRTVAILRISIGVGTDAVCPQLVPQLSPQLEPQEDAIYGPQGVPAPSPVTVTLLTDLIFASTLFVTVNANLSVWVFIAPTSLAVNPEMLAGKVSPRMLDVT
jgi:hypothetical protein